MELPAGLREHPFSYRITSAGEVRVVRDGRSIVTVRGAAARSWRPSWAATMRGISSCSQEPPETTSAATNVGPRCDERLRAEVSHADDTA